MIRALITGATSGIGTATAVSLAEPSATSSWVAAAPATVAALRDWRHIQDSERQLYGCDYNPGDYVFTFEDGRPPHPDTIRKRFDRLAAAAGLPRITFHDLRHSYATGALKAGVSAKVVSDRIGRANVGFFLQTYAHVLKTDDREAAEQAASFLLGPAWDSDSQSGQQP